VRKTACEALQGHFLAALHDAEIFERLTTTRYRTIDQNSGFPLAFHRCDLSG
jgi:hypothetical protein